MSAETRLEAEMIRLFGSRNMQIDRLPLISSVVGWIMKNPSPGHSGMDYVLNGRIRYQIIDSNTVILKTEGISHDKRKQIAQRCIEAAALLGWIHQGAGRFVRTH